MREQYFNSDNLTQKSQELLNHCLPPPNRDNNILDWENSALLVLDMQGIFLGSTSHAFVPSSPYIVQGLIRLIHSFLDNSLPVILTRHIDNSEYNGMMRKWWNKPILETDELSALIPEMQRFDVPVLLKQEYDAFYDTQLSEILKDTAINDLIITGVMTHLCVESTVRSAFVKGYQTYLPVDGTASYNEAFHRASLLNLSHGFAVMTTIDSLILNLAKNFSD